MKKEDKTKKINVDLFLNKKSITKLEDDQADLVSGGVPGTLISWVRISTGSGKNCRTSGTSIFRQGGGDDSGTDDCGSTF